MGVCIQISISTFTYIIEGIEVTNYMYWMYAFWMNIWINAIVVVEMKCDCLVSAYINVSKTNSLEIFFFVKHLVTVDWVNELIYRF